MIFSYWHYSVEIQLKQIFVPKILFLSELAGFRSEIGPNNVRRFFTLMLGCNFFCSGLGYTSGLINLGLQIFGLLQTLDSQFECQDQTELWSDYPDQEDLWSDFPDQSDLWQQLADRSDLWSDFPDQYDFFG